MKSLTAVILFFICGLLLSASQAQQPTPAMVVIQAANGPMAPAPAQAVANKPAAVSPDADAALQAAFKCLQETKAANAQILKKQEDMMQSLDDLQKTADQLRIFSKRTGG